MGSNPAAYRRVAPRFALAGVLLVILPVAAAQQEQAEREPPGLPAVSVPDDPFVINTHAIEEVRVVVVAKGLSHPWGMAFMPDGGILVTERDDGRLRMIRDGVLDPEPVAGVPEVFTGGLAGLMDVALHPAFDENRLVYLSYTRPLPDDAGTVALVRGRLDGMTLRGVEDVFVAEPFGGTTAGARMGFAPDGTLYLTVGGAFRTDPAESRAQDPGSHAGKVLRLRDDGSVPEDNPFVGREGYLPEIFSLGHRNHQGLTLHPETFAPADDRACRAGRGRAERHRGREELRVADRVLWAAVRRRAGVRPVLGAGHGRAARLLVAVHRPGRPDLLHG